jgi:polyisoprenyl-teichoic acid--peptidoglycan teichoic acid transferase
VSATNPVRFPDVREPGTMTKRAWWLVVLNVLIPGSAQLLAGNRRLGRLGVRATVLLWVLGIVAVGLFFVARPVLLTVATNPIALAVGQVLLVCYAALWVVLTLDTLRLVRLIRTLPAARPFIAALSVVALVVGAGSAGYGAYLAGVTRGTVSAIFGSGQYEAPIDGRYNILLLGGDAGPDRMGLRPDSLSVASVDADTGKTTMIGIPRNFEQVRFVEGSPLYGPFPKGYDCGDQCLISYLYTYGQEHPELYPDAKAQGSQPGIEATRDAVAGVLGIKLQYYALIDMKGFSDLVDALGGITLDVKKRLPIGGDENAQGQPINVDGWIEPGKRKLSGYNALWYARARHGSNDYDRMGRQRDVQEAILKQFTPTVVLTKFQAIAEAGKQIVKTDIPSVMLGVLADLAAKSRTQPVTRLEIVPPQFNPGRPDYAKIQAAVTAALKPVKAK